MIDAGIGDPKAHKIQLADLKLAEKALKKPSPRFLKALALTRRVVDEMQEMKIRDLGLSVETAEGRIAKAGQTLRGEELSAASLSATSPSTSRRSRVARSSVSRQTVQGSTRRSRARSGCLPVATFPETEAQFNGHAIEAGDYRIDATSLATEAYGRTVRAATSVKRTRKLWDAASAKPYGRFSIPIRDVNAIPDKLRTVIARLDEGDFTPKDAEFFRGTCAN
jgi:hypothetical protein